MEFLFLFFFVNRRRHFVCLIFFGSTDGNFAFFLAGVFLLFFLYFTHEIKEDGLLEREKEFVTVF